MKKVVLLFLLLMGCSNYKVGQCWNSDTWNKAFKIKEITKLGVFGTLIKRTPVINLIKPDNVEDIYLTFRLFDELKFEEVDCRAFFKEVK